MKQLKVNQNKIFRKLKTKEATVISIILLTNSIDGENNDLVVTNQQYPVITIDQQYPVQLSAICQNLVTIMSELQSDQGTVIKKWSTILQNKETIEIGSTEHNIKINECMNDLANVDQLSKKLMKFESDDSLHLLSLLLVMIGFFSKNIQMGKQIYL